MDATFANRVLLLRRQMKLSQAEFAKKLHISRTYLSAIETGREPSEALKDLFSRIERENVQQGKTPTQSEFASGPRSKLRLAREARGYTQAEFAQKIGYSLPYYQEIEDGGSGMGEKMILKAAEILGVDPQEFRDGADEPVSRSVPFGTFGAVPEMKMGPGMEGSRAKYIPLVGMAECGPNVAWTDGGYTRDGFLAFDPADPKAIAVRLSGDSMSPYADPGDVAMVYPSFKPRNGYLVVAKLNEEMGGDVMLKKYQSNGKVIHLISQNPNYPTLEFTPDSFEYIYPVASVTKILPMKP